MLRSEFGSGGDGLRPSAEESGRSVGPFFHTQEDDDAAKNPDADQDDGNSGKDIAGFRAEGTLPAHTAECTDQSSASSALEQDDNNQKDRQKGQYKRQNRREQSEHSPNPAILPANSFQYRPWYPKTRKCQALEVGSRPPGDCIGAAELELQSAHADDAARRSASYLTLSRIAYLNSGMLSG